MDIFLQQLTNGLAVGGIYALIALGYTMVYGVLKLINFAHGDLFTLGAYLGLSLITSLSLTDRIGPLAGVLVLAVLVMGLIGVVGILLDQAAYNPLRTSPRLSAVISALGASIFFQNAIMLVCGIGNIPGAMIGGLLLGVIEAMGAAYISIAWKDAIAFLVLILILIFRPTGLLGERVAEKV